MKDYHHLLSFCGDCRSLDSSLAYWSTFLRSVILRGTGLSPLMLCTTSNVTWVKSGQRDQGERVSIDSKGKDSTNLRGDVVAVEMLRRKSLPNRGREGSFSSRKVTLGYIVLLFPFKTSSSSRASRCRLILMIPAEWKPLVPDYISSSTE